jgi:hypothetical protein
MESVYHIVAIHVNETSWAQVWRLRFRYLRTGYDRDVPVLGLDHFVHVHILREEPDYSISMLYGCKAIRIPNPSLRLYSCESLTLQFDRMGETCHSFTRLPHTHGRANMETSQQTTTTP